MTNYREKRLAAEHMDKQTQNTTRVRDTEITIRHQTAHMVNKVNFNHTYGQKEAERHKTLATERIYGSIIHASIKTFHEKIQCGCIFVCSVCHQTNFEEHVIPVKKLCSSPHQVLPHDCLTGYKPVDSVEYICLTCKKSIYRGQVPKLSIKNKCGFPIQPPELILFPLKND